LINIKREVFINLPNNTKILNYVIE